MVTEQPGLSFGGLLRQLRTEAKLTQEELAEAAHLSPPGVSALERGVNRTARKDTAELLADALGLAGPVREAFVAAARGRGPAEDVLAARNGSMPGIGQKVTRPVRSCPYRGLLPFGESDADVFYGRERLAAELAAKLAARAADGGLVVVTGASGSGKSSLLRAGLLPILARGEQVPASDRWPRIVMTPTKDPLAELAARLAALGGPDALAVREEMARHPAQAHLAIRSAVLAAAARRDEGAAASGDGAARLVLIVDQFEQVFTLNPDLGGEAARQAFITALCSAAATPAGPGQEPAALVVIAVRGDFSDRCAAVPELVGPLQDGHFVVGPMTESELRVAITGPAEAAGFQIDRALTDTILGDLRVAGADRSAGVLPLLSQAMALTWQHREGDRLTSRGYAQAGGVSHAVQTGADRAYGALPARQQTIARDVLRSMTVASRDGGLARRPVTRHDLYTGLPDAARADIDAVLDAFAAERLAVLDGDRAQIAHDVLLRAWPRLHGWLEEDQASWILHGQLADSAAAWHDSNDDPSFLYRGTQLATLQQAVTRWSANPTRYPALTGTQRDFLQAGERAAARSSRRRRTSLAVLAVLTVLSLIAAGVALQQRGTALTARNQAIANQIAVVADQLTATDPSLAAQFDVAANQFSPTPESETRLLDTTTTPLASRLTSPTGPVESVAFSPDRKILVSGTGDGKIWLWNLTDPARPTRLGQPLAAPSGFAGPVAFSPDGKILAASGDREVWLWNLTDPARPTQLGQPLAAPSGFAGPVAFSPHGKILAAAAENGKVWLWNLTNPVHPTRLGQPLTGGVGLVSGSVAFSPDGKTVAAAAENGKVWLWNLTDPARPIWLGQPPANRGPYGSVAFSPHGKTLATVNGDGKIWLWNLTDPARPTRLSQPLTGGGGSVNTMAFSPDGKTLAAADSPVSGVVWLWNLTDPFSPTRLGQPPSSASGPDGSLAFSPDGKTLAVSSPGNTIRLWNLSSNVLTNPGSVDAMAFSPDSKTLADTGDGMVWLWNLTDPARPTQLGQPLTSLGSYGSVAFSPDRKTLAAATDDGKVWLWNLTDLAHPIQLSQALSGPGSGSAVAFSRDGKTLATVSEDGTIRLWNLDVDNAVQRICATTSNILTFAQWKQYFPQLPFSPPCAHLGRYGFLVP